MKFCSEAFIIYDLSYRKIELPKDVLGNGVQSQLLEISSIGRKTITEELSGISGTSRIHVMDNTRSASITFYLTAMTNADARLKTNRMYTFFRQLGVFYIADAHEPNKLLKVSVDSEYTPSRIGNISLIKEVEIELEIVGQPYRISRFTTLDIHEDSGIVRDGDWGRGMNLTREGEKQNYVFNNQTNISVYNPSDIDLFIKQHLDFKIKFECLQSMSRISLLDANSKEFIFTDSLVTGDIVEIEGHRVKKNGILSAAKFNDVYPTLKSGHSEVYQTYSMNNIKVSAGLKVTFDFRPKYD